MLLKYSLRVCPLLVGVCNALITPRDDPIVPPPHCLCPTLVVDGGDPHQEFLQKQMTETVSDCHGVTCTTTKMDGQAFSWGINLGLMQKDGWINGGFSVGESYSSGFAEACGTDDGDNVCLWYSQAYTAYTVEDHCNDNCGNPGPQNRRVIFSPNDNNAGGLGYYCVKNTCRTLGDTYWNDGDAGGPP